MLCLESLLCLALASAPAAKAAAAPLAVLPVTGEGEAGADRARLEELDAVMRRALTAQKGVALQPRAATVKALEGARAGSSCRLDDFACLRDVATLAGVDLLLVPVARPDPDALELHVTLASVPDESLVTRAVIVKGRGRAADAFVEALVDDVLRAPRKKAAPAPAAVVVTPLEAPAAPEPAAPEEPEAREEGAPAWPWLVAAGAGALVVVAGVVAVAVVLASRPPEG